MNTQEITVAGRCIGGGHPVLVIAEIGVNHNGDPELARRSIAAAVAAGADAVKFQTFRADRLVTASSPKAAYQLKTTGAAESQLQMLRRLELRAEAHRELMSVTRDLGALFLSTPFDTESADLLEQLGVEAYKIGSGELTDLRLIAHVAGKGRPIILSTGMSWLREVDLGVQAVRQTGNTALALLHCVSNYPAAPADLNLRAIETLRRTFDLPAGYSDHTDGVYAPIAAVALGACIIEKHFTLDRALPGPDHMSSLPPDQFAAMVRAIREAEGSLGDGVKRPMPSEESTRAMSRKSVVALEDIAAGALLSDSNLGVRRPGTGIDPSELAGLTGRRARADIAAGTPLSWEMVE